MKHAATLKAIQEDIFDMKKRTVVIPTRKYGRSAIPTVLRRAMDKYLKENPDATKIVKEWLKKK